MEKNSLASNLTDSNLHQNSTHLVALLPQLFVKLVKVVVISFYKTFKKVLVRVNVALGNKLNYKGRMRDEFYFHVSERRGQIPQRVWNRYSALIVHWQLENEARSPQLNESPEALIHVQNSVL